MGTSVERSSANPNNYTRGDYIPGILVDGMDVLAVKNATEFAIKYVLECTPIILEMHTYRYYGHSMSDPGVSYRSRDEIEAVRKEKDPITSFRSVILEHNLATEEEIKAIDSKVKEEINEAVNISKTDKEIPLQELTADIYFMPLEKKIRGTIGRTWDAKIVAKRPEQPLIPPKEKPKFEGYAFTLGAKPSTTAKVEKKKGDNKGSNDEKKEEKVGEEKKTEKEGMATKDGKIEKETSNKSEKKKGGNDEKKGEKVEKEKKTEKEGMVTKDGKIEKETSNKSEKKKGDNKGGNDEKKGEKVVKEKKTEKEGMVTKDGKNEKETSNKSEKKKK